MRIILTAFVEAFEPDYALVTSHEYLNSIETRNSPWGLSGWLIYDQSRSLTQIFENGPFGTIEAAD